MNTLLLLVLVTVSSSIDFVKSQERCDSNLDCISYCCKNGECQKTAFECLTVPTTNTDFLDKCYANTDCYMSTEYCCVNKKCQACTLSTNDPPYQYENNHYDGSSDGSSRSGDRMSAGASSAIGFAVVFLVIVKIGICVSLCSRTSRRRRVVVIRRRTCDFIAPVVENDELQREHERAQQEQQEHRRSPPPYSPQADHHVISSSREQGVSKETPTEPPPEYTNISMDNPIEKNDIDSYEGTPGTGGTDEMNGVPQGETMLPTPSSISPNNADENSK
ncbi:uncharacterized protein LOC114517131 [Dendronephthya gigantea]|uniref:uncharacterized protein LOC114517131 n=1 Tax=Dendronephthya gigantea TaxID=151771 RepID=UPI00106B6612|nr:uncharacterized protein LOC114517131 [Dendronephthya gigantea]